jgi:hypothetical protein
LTGIVEGCLVAEPAMPLDVNMDDTMRKAFWAMMVCCAASASDAMPAAAQNLPYCIKGCDFGLGDCSFTSYQQCLATASGRDAYCAANPYFNAKAELPPHRRMSRRRF